MGSAHSVWITVGLPLLTACVLSQSTLLRLQVALQGNCPKWALGFVYFPGLSFSGFGSQVLHKGTDSGGHAFCALPRSKELRRPGAWWAHSQAVHLNSLPSPSCLVSWMCCKRAVLRCAMCLLWGADLWLRPSWQMSTIQDPRKTQLATGSLFTVWWRMQFLGLRLPLTFQLWLSPTCHPASSWGRGWSAPG